MSITEGVTGGGSWSSNRTLRWSRSPMGIRHNSLGRPNLNLVGFATNRELVLGLLLLGVAGPVAGGLRGLAVRGLNVTTKPLFWAGVNAYQEAEDAAAWLRGEDMSWQASWKLRPVGHPVFGSWAPGVPFIPVPFPYLDFAKSPPSSGGGGPGGILTSTTPPPSIEETGEILSNPPIAGGVTSSPRRSTSKKSRKRQCPKGYLRDPRSGKCVWWSEVSRKHQNAWSR